MPINRLIEHLRPQNKLPELKFRRDDSVEFATTQNITAFEISEVFKRTKLLLNEKGFAKTPEAEHAEIIRKATLLLEAFIEGVNSELKLYESKGLRFKRPTFKLKFIHDEYEDDVYFDHAKNQIGLSFRLLYLHTYLAPGENQESKFQGYINRFKLWGGEEAHHSIYSQLKKTKEKPTYGFSAESYVSSDHEFRALLANIRQAKREHMPQSTIDQMEELLEKARERRKLKPKGPLLGIKPSLL